MPLGRLPRRFEPFQRPDLQRGQDAGSTKETHSHPHELHMQSETSRISLITATVPCYSIFTLWADKYSDENRNKRKIFAMKRFLITALLLCPLPVFSQTAALPVQYCTQGGIQAKTQGLNSSNYLQGIIPSCSVTVYLTGTTTLATIYKDSISTPQTNPFTASNKGSFLIFAAVNQGYDVVLSGGVAPNTYPSPVTITGEYPSTQIISGCGFGTVCPITAGGTGATTAAGALANLGVEPYSVLSSGADPTGVTDSTAAINAAYTHSSYVLIPPGSYLINCGSDSDNQSRHGGIRPTSNTKTVLAAGATVTCAVNTTGYYNAFVGKDVANVVVEIEGVVEGNKTADLAAGASVSSEHGYGIAFSGCVNCAVMGTGTIQNFLGDGIHIAASTTGAGIRSKNIQVGALTLTGSYRNNTSVVDVQGFVLYQGTKLYNAGGTSPQDGIDVEPGSTVDAVDAVILDHIVTQGNANRGINIDANRGTIGEIQVLGGIANSNLGVGFWTTGIHLAHAIVQDMTISNNGECGSGSLNAPDGAITLTNNFYIGNGTASSFPDCPSSGAYFQTSSGFIFAGNTIRAGANSPLPISGLQLNSNTGVNQILNNDLAGSAATTAANKEFNTYAESASDYYSENRLTTGQQPAQNLNIGAAVASSLAINGGSVLTGSVGTGGLAQETTSAAKTSGNCVQFDASGNTVDAGSPCGVSTTLPNGTTATTQTTGDNTAKVATDAFVNAEIAIGGSLPYTPQVAWYAYNSSAEPRSPIRAATATQRPSLLE